MNASTAITSPETLRELERVQTLLLGLVEDLDDYSYRTQFHADLSALGWHLGHCTFVECYWLHEVVRNDGSVTQPLRELYVPPLTPKPERGQRIPAQQDLLEWVRHMQQFNRDCLQQGSVFWGEHALLEDQYLQRFLIQHHSQHYETMLMALSQRAQQRAETYRVDTILHSRTPDTDGLEMPGGHYRIGGTRPESFDNELPPQQAELGPFRIARRPVSNAEFLGFMEAGGYQSQALWSTGGWHWRSDEQIQQPDHWRQDDAGNWYGVGVRGPYDLPAEEPVMGLSHHEAEAYARWAGGRLPHEYQWEAACRVGLLEHTGRAWEWCATPFHPYEGFEPFPYDEYSQPWFDDQHYSLRGGSLYTQPTIKRPSFRNFYLADKRHIFAGLRLAF